MVWECRKESIQTLVSDKRSDGWSRVRLCCLTCQEADEARGELEVIVAMKRLDLEAETLELV